MKSILCGVGLAALSLSLATPAYAGVSADFAGCDGLKKPKRSDDGMRGEATISSFRFRNQDVPTMVIASCDRALESGKLRPEQTLRLAHIMRARAAAKLQIGDLEGSLADLDAAETAAREYEGDFFYERSMGVSIDLLRAIALNDQGKGTEAVAIAEAAAAQRPFALEVQRIASMLRAANSQQPGDTAIWRHLGQIDPATRSLSAQLGSGPEDFAALAASAGEPAVELPGPPSIDAIMNSGGNATPLLGEWNAAVTAPMTTAYALAATGDSAGARAWVDATRVALTPAEVETEDKKKQSTGLVGLLRDMTRSSIFAPMEKVVEARIAISEGRLEDARTVVSDKAFRASALTEEFYSAYAAANADGAAPELPPLGPAIERKGPKLSALADNLLIRPESERKLIDYKEARPNVLGALVGGALSLGTSLLGGIPRTSGFDEAENEDGSIKVEYNGNTTSGPVVQEMTLLRAAEVAQAAGKPYFHIERRNDYQRYLTQLMYGVEQSRTLTGYKTELTIRLLDDAADQPQALEAIAVIDALGPIYYGD